MMLLKQLFTDSIVWTSIITGLILTLATTLINRKMFRDEIAENELVIKIWEYYSEIAFEITKINHILYQAVANMKDVENRFIARNINEKTVQKQISEIKKNEIVPIIEKIIIIKGKISMHCTDEVNRSYNEYEEVAITLGKATGSNERLKQVLEGQGRLYDNLMRSMRIEMGEIISHKKKISDILENIPKDGFLDEFYSNKN